LELSSSCPLVDVEIPLMLISTTGYCGLGRAISTLGLKTSDDIELDVAVASLGALNNELIYALYYAAQGDDGFKEYGQRTAQSKAKKSGINPNLDDRFRIYFPSHDTVVQSHRGKDVSPILISKQKIMLLISCEKSAGTICAQSKWWDSDKFPRHLVRDCKSVRPGLLIHSKIILVRPSQNKKGSSAWGYVGSANLSEAAW
jgi:hypothetical protein